MTVIQHPTEAIPATTTSTTGSAKQAQYVWAGARITMGFIFLWSFFDKLLGFGFATDRDAAWIEGGSPTEGFLQFGTQGPFKDFYVSMAGEVWADWIYMAGMLGLGIAFDARNWDADRRRVRHDAHGDAVHRDHAARAQPARRPAHCLRPGPDRPGVRPCRRHLRIRPSMEADTRRPSFFRPRVTVLVGPPSRITVPSHPWGGAQARDMSDVGSATQVNSGERLRCEGWMPRSA